MHRHRKPNRMHRFDYAQERLYFITSCVENRSCVFGDIVPLNKNVQIQTNHYHFSATHQMVLNAIGNIANQQWYWLERQYPYVYLHSFIVMPNHVHGILEINRACHVGTGRDLSLHDRQTNGLSIKIKSLSELIGAYKTTSSKQIHLWQAPDGSYPYQSFRWQRSFHDHIIRNQMEYDQITRYIHNNPSEWEDDQFRI